MDLGGLIILEGPDGGGKTALADELLHHYRRPHPQSRVIRGSERGWVHEDYGRALREAWLCVQQGGIAIMDRCHWSNDVYERYDRSGPVHSVDYDALDGYVDTRFPWWIGFLCLPSVPYEEAQHKEELVALRQVRHTYVELHLAAYPARRREHGYVTTWDFTQQDVTDVVLAAETARLRAVRKGVAAEIVAG